MDKIITVENLRKSFGEINAVNGIDFYVERGKLFSFLGVNGAGKSTTIDILCTLLTPDSGTVTLDGHVLGRDDDLIRSKIGVVFQDSILDSLLTVEENLMLRASFYNFTGAKRKQAVSDAAAVANVTDFMKRPYGKLSGGQRRRADIARALINTPSILFLDEPTTGLDPKTKDSVWQTIVKLQEQTGMTVFLTTHYMEEAATADYITILNKGEIVANGTPYALKEKYSTDRLHIKTQNKEETIKIINANGFKSIEKNNLIIVNLKQTIDAIPILELAKPLIESFEVIHGSMEDVFLNITGGELNNV